jgi:hypothetical protein
MPSFFDALAIFDAGRNSDLRFLRKPRQRWLTHHRTTAFDRIESGHRRAAFEELADHHCPPNICSEADEKP